MIAITAFSETLFKINDRAYTKDYSATESAGFLYLVSRGNTTPPFKVGKLSEITVDGASYTGDVDAFLNSINEIVFSKGGGNGGGLQTPAEIINAVYVDEAAAIAAGLTTGFQWHTGDYILRIIG